MGVIGDMEIPGYKDGVCEYTDVHLHTCTYELNINRNSGQCPSDNVGAAVR